MLKLATKSERLRWARINAGFPSAAQAARRFGVPYGTYAGHENGLRGIKESELARYAKAFGVTVAWLIYGEEEEDLSKQLVCFFALAGVHPNGRLDAVMENPNTDWLTYPRFSDKPSAYIIVGGDLVRGIAESGWHITLDRTFTAPSDEHLGCLCVCKIKGGNYYLAILQKGHAPGRYNLEGPLFSTNRNQIIEKVSYVSSVLTSSTVRELKIYNKDRIDLFTRGIDFDMEEFGPGPKAE